MKKKRGLLAWTVALVFGAAPAAVAQAPAKEKTVSQNTVRRAQPAAKTRLAVFRNEAERLRWCDQTEAVLAHVASKQNLPAKDQRRLRRMADAMRSPKFFQVAS